MCSKKEWKHIPEQRLHLFDAILNGDLCYFGETMLFRWMLLKKYYFIIVIFVKWGYSGSGLSDNTNKTSQN